MRGSQIDSQELVTMGFLEREPFLTGYVNLVLVFHVVLYHLVYTERRQPGQHHCLGITYLHLVAKGEPQGQGICYLKTDWRQRVAEEIVGFTRLLDITCWRRLDTTGTSLWATMWFLAEHSLTAQLQSKWWGGTSARTERAVHGWRVRRQRERWNWRAGAQEGRLASQDI